MKEMIGTVCSLLLFEYYTTCGSALEVCRGHPVDQLFNRPKETGEEEAETAESKATFLDTPKKPAAAGK
jgi:hypothetical protein